MVLIPGQGNLLKYRLSVFTDSPFEASHQPVLSRRPPVFHGYRFRAPFFSFFSTVPPPASGTFTSPAYLACYIIAAPREITSGPFLSRVFSCEADSSFLVPVRLFFASSSSVWRTVPHLASLCTGSKEGPLPPLLVKWGRLPYSFSLSSVPQSRT